jgi:hypothetical protein
VLSVGNKLVWKRNGKFRKLTAYVRSEVLRAVTIDVGWKAVLQGKRTHQILTASSYICVNLQGMTAFLNLRKFLIQSSI